MRSIIRFVMRIIADIEVHGLEELPDGNLIGAANHLGRLDTAAMLCVIDREDLIMPVAEKYKNHPLFGAIGRAANAIWLNRFEADFSALREILARMEQGGLLVIAPEGTRSRTEVMQEAKPAHCAPLTGPKARAISSSVAPMAGPEFARARASQ